MPRIRQNWVPILLGCVFLVLVSLPYLVAWQNSGVDHHFGGFLLNPIDGNSYLAKMYQGWQGEWRYKLPYTAEPGNGGYLFLFYLVLGHLSRLTRINSHVIFHLARLCGALVLAASLWNFFKALLRTARARWIAFGLALFGSGLGWIGAAFQVFSPDFWVAEGYPFLSAYANPHFPLSMAIMLWILTPRIQSGGEPIEGGSFKFRPYLLAAAGAALGIILPFGVVITAVILASLATWQGMDGFKDRDQARGLSRWLKGIVETDAFQSLVYVMLVGGPLLIYQLWVIRSDPILAAWDAQNLTPSPPFWQLLMAYAPVLIPALPGGFIAARAGDKKLRILLVWALVGLLLMYIPWNLQRRFITGYMVPLAGLAAIGLDRFITRSRLLGMAALVLVAILILPTNLIILQGGLQAADQKEGQLYLTAGEHQALLWLEENTPPDAVILASPQMGLYIPAYTGRRVLYGHPFETVDAEHMEAQVLNFLAGESLEGLGPQVDYLFYGDRERSLSKKNPESQFELLYETGEVQIFRLDQQS